MALTELTKVTGPGIHTLSNVLSHNIKSSGIITATKFSGPLDSIGGNFAGVITATNGVFSGNVSIGGTLTYEDVTNIDSVGIITARDGLKVLGGGANIVGVVTATGADINGDLDVDGHTELDNGNVSGVVTFTNSPNAIQMNDNARVSFGTSLKTAITYNSSESKTKIVNFNDTLQIGYRNTEIYHTNQARLTFDSGNTFSNVVNTSFSGANYNAVWIPSSDTFRLNDNAKLVLGTNTDTTIYHNNSNLLISNTTGNIDVTGNVVLNNDISVDGHTNLDNVSIAGVTTMSGNLTISNTAPTLFLTDSNGDDFSLVVNGGVFRLRDETNGENRLTLSSSGVLHAMSTVTLGEATFGSSSITKVFSGTGGIKKNALMVLNPTASVAGRGAGVAVGAIGSGEDYIGTLYASRSSDGDNRGTTTLEGKDAIVIKTNAATSTVTAATIDTSGRVLISNTLGLGGATSTPSELLHAQTVSGEGKIVLMGATTGTLAISGLNGASRVLFGDSSTENAGNITYTHSSDTLSFRINGNTRWKFDSSGHFLPDSVGSYDIGSATAEIGNVYLADNKKVFLGSDQDLEIFHDGSHSRIKDVGTGILSLSASQLNIQNAAVSENMAEFFENGAVNLYYDHSAHATAKLATTATGVSVHGEVAATQDYPNQRPALDFNFAQEKVLDPRLMFARDGDGSYYDEFGLVRLAGRNEPRFDHDPVTRESKGLLIEETRTNYFPYGTTPGDFWSSSKSGTFEEYTTETAAPDGTFTATKWTFTNTDPYLYHAYTLAANTTYTMSMWVKAGTNMAGDRVQMRLGGAPYSSGDAEVIPADGTWRRISYTRTIGGSAENSANVGFEPQTSPSGNPASGDVIYIWGAQLEVGHFMSSFIPTNGEVRTRYQDTLRMTGDDLTNVFNTTEGTMFYEASVTNLTNDNQPIVAFRDQDNTTGNEIPMGYRIGGGASGNIRTWIRSYVTGSQVNSFLTNHSSTGMVAGKPYKHMMAFKKDDFACSYNTGANSAQLTSSSGNLPVAGSIDELRFGAYYNNLSTYALESGHIKRFSYWPVRLTNTQLTTYIA